MTDSNTDSSDDEDRRSTEDVYREIHDWTSADSLSSTLLTALADVKDVAPTDLEPLYETLDPEALDNLFGSDGDGFRADGHVSFPVAGCDVSIYSHGEFAVISIKKSPESVDFGGGWRTRTTQRPSNRVSKSLFGRLHRMAFQWKGDGWYAPCRRSSLSWKSRSQKWFVDLTEAATQRGSLLRVHPVLRFERCTRSPG